MSSHTAPVASQRCQRVVVLIVAVPAHLPADDDIVVPTLIEPAARAVGGDTLAGAMPSTAAVGTLKRAALPPALTPVTVRRMYLPTSADVGVNVVRVAPV